jgi:GNAT superfamily N-acetyltransferase
MTDAQEWRRGSAVICTDRRRIQIEVVHGFLSGSYWAKNIPRAVVERSIEGSLCFGIYEPGPRERQVGFARVITDFATFAYLADVFVVETARGKGLARWLMEVIDGHPRLQGLRRWMLVTRDAHGLYRRFGYVPVASPADTMERRRTAAELYGP